MDVCIVDDGSDDQQAFLDIVTAFKDPRLRYFVNSENKGKWYCLNEAIKTTTASICTAHDADDVALKQRIEAQYATMKRTQTIHNLCGFYHCYSEDHVKKYKGLSLDLDEIKIVGPAEVAQQCIVGYRTPGVNHYYTGNFETAGVSAMFYKDLWDCGLRFQPPGLGLRALVSEDSDFNFRATMFFKQTSVTAEKLYCYRRNTSTNKEEI
tara:strand:+ start:1034 stop:1660 length:627 start_codon:yes stop_codon:yes gene_type:complete